MVASSLRNRRTPRRNHDSRLKSLSAASILALKLDLRREQVQRAQSSCYDSEVNPGIRLKQRLEGTYHRLDDPGDERPIAVDLVIYLGVVRAFRQRAGELTGTVHAPGLAEDCTLLGEFEFQLDGRIGYKFHFGKGEWPFRFSGESEWDLLRPKRSLERVFGRIYEKETEVARVLLHTPLEQSLIQLLFGARPFLQRH